MSESIYNLIPYEYEEQKKPKVFKPHKPSSFQKIPNSTFGCHGSTRPLGAGMVTKKSGALFGPPQNEYMIKKEASGSVNAHTAESFASSKYTSDERRPRVPRRDEKPIMGITTSKNYITANAVEAILQVPKQYEKPELNYLKKEEYGKKPAYLDQVKDEIRRENEMIEKYVKEQMGEIEEAPVVYEQMSDEEAVELLIALKNKWTAVNREYQKITHLVLLDTTGQVRRKEQYEAELTQLEKDIDKLSRASSILIKE
jgi:hypothetical protein